MNKPFKGNFLLTQGFGEHPEWYEKYGILAHDGLDYNLPCETKLISPIAGQITEVADDPQGYGLYIKIENSAEGCLLAHLSQQDVVAGQQVDQGQHLGWSGTTGNSSGCHLHWGYFRKPRDRSNGFNGYIDPTPYFTEDGIIPPPANMTDEQKRVFQFIEENKGEETNLESVVRSWHGAFLAQQSPSNPSNPPDLSISDLLVLLIKKIFK